MPRDAGFWTLILMTVTGSAVLIVQAIYGDWTEK